MARASRLEVLSAILDSGLLPLFSATDADVAAAVVDACAAGGAPAIELTDRGDRAAGVFASVVARRDRAGASRGPILGVGSVVDAPTAALYIGLGAEFVVAPSFDPDVAALCNRRRVAYIPGCATVTEIVAAETAGCEIVKLFPADTLGGPAFVRALLGPRPRTLLLASGGVAPTRESVEGWISAGAAVLGMGSRLISSPVAAGTDLEPLRRRVSDVLGWIREARRPPGT